jgi:hypothetical protein
MSDMRLFCKSVAVATVFFLVIVSSRVQAVADEVPRSWAIVTLTGSASINNAPAFSGQTLFATNTIVTAISSLHSARRAFGPCAIQAFVWPGKTNQSLDCVLNCSHFEGVVSARSHNC